jgi:hypothetical protein
LALAISLDVQNGCGETMVVFYLRIIQQQQQQQHKHIEKRETTEEDIQ